MKIILLLIFLSTGAFAQVNDIVFEKINVKQGLPNDHPRSIMQDSYGYLWFTSEGGLYKYDGYEYQVFQSDANDTNSFNAQFVVGMCEDKNGKIWFTTDKGLQYYDYNFGGFQKLKYPTKFKDSKLGAINIDTSGNILAIPLSNDGVFIIDNKFEFSYYKLKLKNREAPSFFSISPIVVDKKNRAWISFSKGLSVFDATNKKFIDTDYNKSWQVLKNKSITALYNENNKRIWIGCKEGDIYFIDIINKNFPVQKIIVNKKYNNLIKGEPISSMLVDEDNKLWIGTDSFKRGLFIVDINTKNFEYFNSRRRPEDNLSTNRIHSIYKDKSDVIWISTGRGGLNKWDKYSHKFKEIFEDTKENIKSNGPFNGTNVLSNGNILVFDFDGVLIEIDGRTKKELFRNRIIGKNGKPIDVVSTLEISLNEIILNTYVGKIYIYNSVKKTIKELKLKNRIITNKTKNVRTSFTSNIVIDKNKLLWTAAQIENQSYVLSINIKTKTIMKFLVPNGGKSIFNYPRGLAIDKNDDLWVGTNGSGVFSFNTKTKKFRNYSYNKLGTVNGFVELENGKIWIASKQGIFILDKNNGVEKRLTPADGLIHIDINNLVEDNYGNLWAFSFIGISQINPRTLEIRNFDNSDGFPYDERARFNGTKSAPILFTSGRTIYDINPTNLFDNTNSPILNITKLEVSGKNILPQNSKILNKYIANTKILKLNHNQNDITLEYVGINYSRTNKINYAYFLEGYDTDWQYVKKQKRAKYTNLPSGNYNFKVKAKNADGIWTKEPTILNIIIYPPWWATWWAYSIYFVMVLLFLYTIREFELKRQRKNSEIKESQLKAKAAEAQSKVIQAENERKSKELEEARQLQLSMLPQELPNLPNIDIAVYMQTATEVGGDYYDFRMGIDGTLNVALGDATGHGLKAGTLVTIMKGLFTSEAENNNVLTFFSKSSKAIKDIKLGRLMMAFAFLKIKDMQLSLANAGVPPIYIYRKENNEVEEIDNKGMPLGAMKNFPYKETKVELKKGDVIFLLSDGFPELFNDKKEMFGYERVVSTFKGIAIKSSKEIIEHLKKTASDWANGKDPDDDVTFVVLKMK